MFTLTCWDCHQAWHVDQLPPPLLTGLGASFVLPAPCGHGQFMGTLPMVPLLFEGSMEALWRQANWWWYWYDTKYVETMRAIELYDSQHPRPVLPPWDPPDLLITCACQTRVRLTGSTEVGEGEGWEGKCPTCGLSYGVWDEEGQHPYTKKRFQPYHTAIEAWYAQRPTVPSPVKVTLTDFLQEREDGNVS